MKFKNIDIESRNIINKYLTKENRISCAYCFTDIFIWKDKYHTQYCIEDDCLYLRQYDDESDLYYYYIPMNSKNLQDGINSIIIDSIENKYKFCFGNIEEKYINIFKEEYKDIFSVKLVRDFSDYIYNASDLINLSGKKFHKKKNLFNKFMREYEGRYEYRNITSKDINDILAFNKIWCEKNVSKDSDDMAAETRAITLALKNFEKLELKGGMLLVDGKIIAYTLGSKNNDDTFVVQIEKALVEYSGAYQVINNLFAKNNLEGYKYINREEDLGLEGLRKAKLSYNPVIIEDYYMAVAHIDRIEVKNAFLNHCVFTNSYNKL